MNITKFIYAYVTCALWSSNDEDHDTFDEFHINNLTIPCFIKMRTDCDNFTVENAALLKGLDSKQCGHDFWLTRNGHGAGFWDRNLGEVGDKLTEACKKYSECYLYLTENGEIDIE